MSKAIDLGQKPVPMAEVGAKSAPKTSYPTVFISHKVGSGLESLPDGEFEFSGRGQVVSHKENMKDGTSQTEIEIISIKPSSTKAKKAKAPEDGLDEALTKISSDKSAPDEAEAVDNPAEDTAEGE